jgi:hypothetical protein
LGTDIRDILSTSSVWASSTGSSPAPIEQSLS